MEYKAIETHYNGYRFRSRLEARWAVFFDEAGIKYEYEPEGFEKEVDGELIRYLPDFYFPDYDWYVVKYCTYEQSTTACPNMYAYYQMMMRERNWLFQ